MSKTCVNIKILCCKEEFLKPSISTFFKLQHHVTPDFLLYTLKSVFSVLLFFTLFSVHGKEFFISSTYVPWTCVEEIHPFEEHNYCKKKKEKKNTSLFTDPIIGSNRICPVTPKPQKYPCLCRHRPQRSILSISRGTTQQTTSGIHHMAALCAVSCVLKTPSSSGPTHKAHINVREFYIPDFMNHEKIFSVRWFFRFELHEFSDTSFLFCTTCKQNHNGWQHTCSHISLSLTFCVHCSFLYFCISAADILHYNVKSG